ncbi:sensor histidine kinase [Desulforamulus ruminis]|uniref:sensor histidine kinase n=1 Tax=Desulforamulus ruminis TaxID=1564 RepID=UPI002FDAB4A1
MFWLRDRVINFTSLRWRLGISYAVMAILVTALLTGMAVKTSMTIALTSQQEKALSAINGITDAFAHSLTLSSDPAQSAKQLGMAAGGRVLWLGPDDRVRVDGYGEAGLSGQAFPLPSQLKDPEVKKAEIYDTGKSWAAYTSAPLKIAGKSSGRLILVQDLSALRQQYVQLQQRLWLLGGVCSILVTAMGLFLANSLSSPLERLTRAIGRIRAGELHQSVPAAGSREMICLAETFNDMAARIAQLDEQRRAFIADAAHELRTPLASLQALAEGMQQNSSPQTGELEAFVRQTERLGRLVGSLLLLAKLDNPELQIIPVPIKACSLLEEALWVMKPLAAERQVKLEMKEAGEAWIEGDPDWLHQALVNVLGNAVYYTPTGGRIGIQTEIKQGQVHVVIEDSGKGVPMEVLTRLGTRFFRPSTARERSSGGSGLGLSIVKDILRLHNGRLGFASPPGKGLTVRLIIPEISPPDQNL